MTCILHKSRKRSASSSARIKVSGMTEKKPKWNSVKEIVVHSFKGALRSYGLAFGIKSLVSLLIKIAKRSAISKDLIRRSLDFNFANMIGSYTFIWKLLSNLLLYKTGQFTKLNGFVAGSVAGLSIAFETKENRIGYAQQFFMRSMHTCKNHLKGNGIYIPYGDSIMFSFACASILYAFSFRSDTIPREYYGWMVARTRVPKVMQFN